MRYALLVLFIQCEEEKEAEEKEEAVERLIEFDI